MLHFALSALSCGCHPGIVPAASAPRHAARAQAFANEAPDVEALQAHPARPGDRQPAIVPKVETRRGFEHLPLRDLAEDRDSIALIESFVGAGKPVALVCHAPGVLRHVRTPAGRPLVEGKQVTGFTNSEEAAGGLTDVAPFLVEDELKAKGGVFSRGADWRSYVVRDGLLITGQNPGSSAEAAAALMARLRA